MIRLYVEPEAEEELDEAADRYEAAVPGLGQQFVAEMRQRVHNVLETPLSFPVFGDADDVRCAHAIGRFPHLVVFMLVGDAVSPTVHVLAFMHPVVSQNAISSFTRPLAGRSSATRRASRVGGCALRPMATRARGRG